MAKFFHIQRATSRATYVLFELDTEVLPVPSANYILFWLAKKLGKISDGQQITEISFQTRIVALQGERLLPQVWDFLTLTGTIKAQAGESDRDTTPSSRVE